MEKPSYTPEEEERLIKLNEELASAGIPTQIMHMLRRQRSAYGGAKPYFMSPFYVEEVKSKDPYEGVQRQIVVAVQWVKGLEARETRFETFGFPEDYRRAPYGLTFEQTQTLYRVDTFNSPKHK